MGVQQWIKKKVPAFIKLPFKSGVTKSQHVRVRVTFQILELNPLIIQVEKFRPREEKEIPPWSPNKLEAKLEF